MEHRAPPKLSHEAIFDHVIDELRAVLPDDCEHLNENNLVEIKETMSGIIGTEEKHTEVLWRCFKEQTDLYTEMKGILSECKFKEMLDGFDIETFTLEVTKPSVPQDLPVVNFRRGGKDFLPPIHLLSVEAVDFSRYVQIADLVLEVVLFLLEVVGIHVALNDRNIKAITKGTIPLLRSSEFDAALVEFLKAWNKGGTLNRAKAMFVFVRDLRGYQILTKVVKLVFYESSWWQRIKDIAVLLAMLMATFATDGCALIARIVVALDNAVKLFVKLKNIMELNTMKKELNEMNN